MFPQRGQEDLRAKDSNLLLAMTSDPLDQSFISITHVLTLLFVLEICSWRRHSSLRSRRRCLIAGRMSKKLCITKAYPTFLRSSELSWLIGIMIRPLWYWQIIKSSLLRKVTKSAVTINWYTWPYKGLYWPCSLTLWPL